MSNPSDAAPAAQPSLCAETAAMYNEALEDLP